MPILRRLHLIHVGAGVFACAALAAGCGSTPYGGIPVASDGGAFADGGPFADGGSVVDGGTAGDGGVFVDGGSPSDGGATPDGGGVDGGGPDGGVSDLGVACADDNTCQGGFCITEPESGWPGGYCSASCRGRACPGGGICYARFAVCLRSCEGGCRDGYACTDRLGADVLPRAACVPGRAGAHVGDACTTAGQCPAGGYCLTETSEGYPGGYCSLTCQPGNPTSCGDGAVCATFDGSGGQRQATCLRSCAVDGDCRAPGYVCEQSWFGVALASKACVPGTRAEVAVGAVCANQGACPPGWFCLTGQSGFPGGYCTRACGMPNQPACPGDAFCDPALEVCLDGCAQNSDCRGPLYACAGRLLGIELRQTTCVPYAVSAHVGDPCERFNDCTLGGYCIPERDDQGDPTGFTGGYCSATCEGGCPSGSFCATFGDFSTCVEQCAMAGECRTNENYQCTAPPGGGNTNACLPRPSGGG